MKWFFLLVLLIGLGVFLANALDMEKVDPLVARGPGNVAFPLVLVGVVFVIGLGAWKLLFRD